MTRRIEIIPLEPKSIKKLKAELKAEAMKAAQVKADKGKLAKILRRADGKRN